MSPNLISRRKLLDGTQQDLLKLDKIVISLSNNDNIAMQGSGTAFNDIEELRILIGENEFNEVISLCEITPSALLGKFKNKENLNSFFYQASTPSKNEYIIITSYGEFQPGRYLLCLEGIWKIQDFIQAKSIL